jgi:hypothetical protein
MEHRVAPNENKMSDDGRGRAALGRVEVISNVDPERSGVRSIAWLDAPVVIGARAMRNTSMPQE